MNGFNFRKFLGTDFEPRQETISLPDLHDFFDEGEKPEFTIKGLTGHELGRVHEAMEKNKNISAILEGLVSPDQKEKIAALKGALGLSDKTPDDIARRIQLLILGSVEPKFDQEAAVKFCRVFPVEFFQLTNRITELTGQGHTLGKQKPSGVTQESGRP